MAGVEDGAARAGASLCSKPQSAVDRSKLRFCLAAELAASSARRERSFKQSSPPARAGCDSSARPVTNGALMTLREAPRPARCHKVGNHRPPKE